MSDNPASGARYLVQGMRLIARPGLRRFVLVPLLINLVVFAAAIWYGLAQLDAVVLWMESKVPSWLHWLEWFLRPLFVLALLVAVFYAFSLVANLIASPFNGLLAEKVELHLTGQPLSEGGGIRQALVGLIPTLFDEIGKLLHALLWAIPFLILFLIPGINLAAPVLWFLYSAWMLNLEYADYPMGNHGLKAREMRRRLRGRWVLGLGFGAATAGMTMVPVVNFIVMPSAVAGATAMWVEELREEAAPGSTSPASARAPSS